MKIKLLDIIIVSCCLLLSACEVDNFKTPDTQFFGSIIDEETNELIQQDLIEGSRIDYVEQNYSDNPPTRQIRFHSDGTFLQNNLFAGTYMVRAVRGNFYPTTADTIKISGATEYHFKSSPYIRIKNVDFTFDDVKGKVAATFTLESYTRVASIHLLGSESANVSWSIRSLTVSRNIGTMVDSETEYRLEASTEDLVSGKNYYFRIAALVAGFAEAKHNYSAPVKMTIDNSNVVPEPPEPPRGKSFDACESLDSWSSWGTLSLDFDRPKQGEYSIKTVVNPDFHVLFLKTVTTPFNTEVTKANGYFSFWMYVSDAANFGDNIQPGGAEIEITSSGTHDTNEIHWSIGRDVQLVTGWNKVELKLSDGSEVGDCNLGAINHFRIYNTEMTGAVELKIDDLRFYKEGE
jgi:hypothetical protein